MCQVNIVIFSGGVKLRRQHWCLLALLGLALLVCLGILLPISSSTANLSKAPNTTSLAAKLSSVLYYLWFCSFSTIF